MNIHAHTHTLESVLILESDVRALRDSGCELFSLELMRELCEMGIITDDDGSGYWADNQYYIWNYPICFPFDEADKPIWATQIAWFSK